VPEASDEHRNHRSGRECGYETDVRVPATVDSVRVFAVVFADPSRAGTRAPTSQASSSRGSNRISRPSLINGIRFPATRRRRWRTDTPNCSATSLTLAKRVVLSANFRALATFVTPNYRHRPTPDWTTLPRVTTSPR
jgi:hypothetical protein